MKDSSVEWIGMIPDGWSIRKVKSLYSLQTGFTPDTKKETYYDENGYDWITIGDLNGSKTIPSSTKAHISQEYIDKFAPVPTPKGSLLYSFKLSVGQVAFADRDVFTNEAIASFFNDGRQNLNYLYYSSCMIVENANDNIYGAKILNQELIKNAVVTVPPLSEQQRIADYLDTKCAAIDDVIAKTNESIEEYKKLKQAVITEAVTKGVRGKRPMKDSGVDWIGQIPKDWILQKLKYQIDYIESGVSVNAGQSEAEDGQYGVLKTSSVSKQVFDVHENKNVNPEEIERVECPVKANTIIVSRMNTPDLVGACGYVDKDYDNIFLPDRLWQVHFQEKTCVKFVYYWLRSTNVRNYYSSLAVGTSSSMQNISQDQFYHIFCPNFDKDEQQEIADYLDSKCAAIDSLISKKQQFIDELTAYKKSLIYEYVTGKKEVPA